MKKSTVLKIYKELNMTECITDYLYKLVDLKGDAEYIFLDFCTKHKDIIDEDNIEYLMTLSSSLCTVEVLSLRKKLIDNIDTMLENEIITSSDDLGVILENIIYILTIDVSTAFSCEGKEEFDYYMTEILCNFIKGLCKCSKYDIDKLYSHDMNFIIANIFNVLEDLNRTTCDKFEDSNSALLKRIELFLDIIFDKNIYELDDNRYRVVLDIASTIEDNNDLSKIKSKALICRNLDDDDFIEALDDSVKELTETTVNRLYKKLNIKSINDDEKNTIERKYDNEEEELEIIKMVLSMQK